MSNGSYLEYFLGKDKQWYWRVVAANGNELSRSSEGYAHQEDAENAYNSTIEAKPKSRG